MSQSGSNVFDVTVDRKELRAVLERISLLNKGKKPYQLVMDFEADMLTLITPKVTKALPACGLATVQIQTAGAVLVRTAAAFPESKTIRFLLDGDHIRIDRLSLPCKVVQGQ